MRVSFPSLVLSLAIALGILTALTAWWLTVPKLLTPSSFLASIGLLAGCVWVTTITYINARPANSLAQSLHDIDTADAARRARRMR